MANEWMTYALLSALFAGLVAVLSKIGLKNVDSNLATAIRAVVMCLFLLIVVMVQKKYLLLESLTTSHYVFIVFAGIAGALSWLFYFLALRAGDASKVAALDRLSIVFVLIFSLLFLGEKFSLKVAGGIVLIVAGAIMMVL